LVVSPEAALENFKAREEISSSDYATGFKYPDVDLELVELKNVCIS
jgi:hypothetical protein